MTIDVARRVAVSAIAGLLAAIAQPASAQASNASPSGDWAWYFSINGWLPSVDATTHFRPPGGGNITSETDPGSYLSNLEFTFMGTLEARRGRWSILADAVYLSFGDYKSKVTSITGPGGAVAIPVDTGTETDLKGFVTTIVGGYNVSQGPGSRMDIVGGARYTRLKVGLDWKLSGPTGGVSASGAVEETKDFFDGVVGVRGRTDLGGPWDLRYYLDAGAGSSKFTWQAFAAIGYRFHWGDVILGYRHLTYELHDDRPVADMTFSGLQIAVGFTF